MNFILSISRNSVLEDTVPLVTSIDRGSVFYVGEVRNSGGHCSDGERRYSDVGRVWKGPRPSFEAAVRYLSSTVHKELFPT